MLRKRSQTVKQSSSHRRLLKKLDPLKPVSFPFAKMAALPGLPRLRLHHIPPPSQSHQKKKIIAPPTHTAGLHSLLNRGGLWPFCKQFHTHETIMEGTFTY